MGDTGTTGKKAERGLRTRGVWRDPFVRFLIVLIALAVVGALLTGIFALTRGVVNLDNTPQTITDLDVSSARKSIETNGRAEDYADLAMRLADSGKMTDAREVLEQAEAAKLDVKQTQALLYARGYLYSKESRFDEAITSYRETMDLLLTAYEQELKSGESPNWAEAYGKPDNYYAASLALAEIYQSRKEYKEELGYLKIFLEGYPQDGSVLARRGQVQLELGNKKAAKKDFKSALKYLPDDPDALAGLKQVEEK